MNDEVVYGNVKNIDRNDLADKNNRRIQELFVTKKESLAYFGYNEFFQKKK